MNDLEKRILEIVSDVLGVDLSEVSLTSSFVEDLGSDKTDMLGLQVGIEDEFEVDFSDQVWQDLKTVGDLVSLLSKGEDKR